MMHMHLSLSLSRWVVWMLGKKQMRFKENKVGKRWSQLEKSVALDEWRANAKLQRQAECSRGKAASKRLHLGVAGAFKTWSTNSDEYARQRRIMDRVVSRWNRRALMAA